MIVYFLLYMLILLGTPILTNSDRTLERKREKSTIYITLLVILVVGLRHPSMGWDLQYQKPYGYFWSFENIAQLPLRDVIQKTSWLNYEWGYILYNKLLGYVSTNESWLLFASASLSFVPVGIMIGRHSKDPVFSWIVYLGLPCFLIPFSGLRQAIAIGIVCLSFLYIQQRKLIKFVIVIWIASLFHSSAMIVLIAYPLYRMKLKPKIRMWSIPALAVVFILRRPFFLIASRLFKDNVRVDDTHAFTLLLVFVLIYLFCCVFMKNDDEEAAGFLNLFYFACICQAFGGLSQLAIRVGYYFMPPLAIALPGIVKNMTINNYKISRPVLISIFAIYGLYALYTSSWPMAYPYHFFWNNL